VGPRAILEIQRRDISLASVGNQTLGYASLSLVVTMTTLSRLLYTVGSCFTTGLHPRIFGCKLNFRKMSTI